MKLKLDKNQKTIKEIIAELEKGYISKEGKLFTDAIIKAAKHLQSSDATKLSTISKSKNDKKVYELLGYFIGKWTSLKKLQRLELDLSEYESDEKHVTNNLKASLYKILKDNNFQRKLEDVPFFLSNKYVIYTIADHIQETNKKLFEEKKLARLGSVNHGYIFKDKQKYMLPSEASKRLFEKGISVNINKAISLNTLRNYTNEGLIPFHWYKELFGTYYVDKVGRKKNLRLFPDNKEFYTSVVETIKSKQKRMRKGK